MEAAPGERRGTNPSQKMLAPGVILIKLKTQHALYLLFTFLALVQRQDTSLVLGASLDQNSPQNAQDEANKQTSSPTSPKQSVSECEVFADYGKNYLTPVDVVVKNSEDNVACIKAQFALSIKVEEEVKLAPHLASKPQANKNNDTIRYIIGYLPLEHVLSVEDSCPTKKQADQNESKTANAGKEETIQSNNDDSGGGGGGGGAGEEPPETQIDELEMIVTFNCGKLSFTFKRDKARIFVSSIKGVVKLDKNVVREFISVRPMFITSDLDHHFKYDDVIEVVSEAESRTYILTANFYFTEIEAFRNTTARGFIQPPDEGSKPFSDETPIGAPIKGNSTSDKPAEGAGKESELNIEQQQKQQLASSTRQLPTPSMPPASETSKRAE